MAGFLFLLILGLAIAVGYLGNKTKRLKHQLSEINQKMNFLYQKLQDLQNQITQTPTDRVQPPELQEGKEQAAEQQEHLPVAEDEIQAVKMYPEMQPISQLPLEGEKTTSVPDESGSTRDPAVAVEKPVSSAPPARTRIEWEMLIGGRWLNRIGAIAFVIGLAFFIKYAFDHNWINEIVRVLAGGVIGLLLLGGGAKSYKKGLPVFGQGLTGAGIATLYLSVFASFNFYHFVSIEVAFLLMSAITVLAFQQALTFNSLAISILAWIGGILTPFLLSTNEGSTLGLFSYLAFLTLGMLLIMVKKEKWSILYYLTLGAVYFIYISWILFIGQATELALQTIFLLIFWGLFFAYELRFTLRPAQWPVAQSVASSCHLFFFFIGWVILLEPEHHDWLGPVTLLIGMLYLAPLIWWKRKQKLSSVPKREILRYGFSFILFLTIANGIYWEGVHVVYAWTLQDLAVSWWGARKQIRSVAGYATALYGLTTLVLFVYTASLQINLADWVPIFNKHALAYLLLGGALIVSARLIKRMQDPWSRYIAAGLQVGWAMLIFIFITAETGWYFDQLLRVASPDVRDSLGYVRYLILSTGWMAYSLLIARVGYVQRSRSLVGTSWFILGAGVIFLAVWGMMYGPIDSFVPVYNLRFICMVIAGGILYLHLRWWTRMEHGMKLPVLPVVMTVTMSLLFFELITLEVGDAFDRQIAHESASISILSYMKYLSMYLSWLIYSLIIGWIGYRFRLNCLVYVSWTVLGLGVLAAVVQSFSYPMAEQFFPVINLRFVVLLTAAAVLFIQLQWWKKQAPAAQIRYLPFIFTMTIVIILFELVTVEVSDYFEKARYLADQSDTRLLMKLDNLHQMSLSIAWLCYSLALLALGIWRKMQILRMIAIGLFGLTIFKIFLFDLSFLGTLYRIFSFMGLGVILLVVSYLYQRYKHWFNQSM